MAAAVAGGRRGRALTTAPHAAAREYDPVRQKRTADSQTDMTSHLQQHPPRNLPKAGYVMIRVAYTPPQGAVEAIHMPARYDTKMTDVFHSVCNALNSRFNAQLAYHKIGLAVRDPNSKEAMPDTVSPSGSPLTPPQVSLGERATSNIQVKTNSKVGANSFSQCGAAYIATEKVSAREKVVNFLKSKLKRRGKHDAELVLPKEFRNTILFATDHPLHHVPYVAWCISVGKAADFCIAMTAAPSLQQRRLSSPPAKMLSVVTPPKGF